MSIFGNDSIKIVFTLDNVGYEKTLVKKNYFYDHNYNKKLYKLRRDIRAEKNGTRKQVFKGNEKEFTYTLFNITKSEWDGIYSKIAQLNSIDVYPHFDLNYPYECYCDKIEFKLHEIKDIGKVEFVFKSNSYKDTRVPNFIVVNNILVSGGILLSGYYLNGEKI